VWLTLLVGLLGAAAVAVCFGLCCRARSVARRAQLARAAEAERLRELEKLAARNGAILQSAMDGFFVLGEDYRFQEVNDAFCGMVGYSVSELLQMKMTDLEVSAPVRDGGSGAYWRTGLHHFATAHRHKDGHIVQLESCVVVLRDGPAKILVGFSRDVTERCRAEQALRDSESKYRNLVETSRDLIWSLDLEGRWTFVNNAARDVYGYEPEELLGRSLLDRVRPERVEEARQVLAELRSGKPRFRFETEHVRRDGAVVFLRINALPVRDDYGSVVGITGTSTDLTARRQAEQRLQMANTRFESLVARMPLGYIVWSADFRVLEWNPAASAIFGYTAEQAVGRLATELIVPAESRAAFEAMSAALIRGVPDTGLVLASRRSNGDTIHCEWHNTALPEAGGGIQRIVTLVRDVSERERLEAQLRQSQKLERFQQLVGGDHGQRFAGDGEAARGRRGARAACARGQCGSPGDGSDQADAGVCRARDVRRTDHGPQCARAGDGGLRGGGGAQEDRPAHPDPVRPAAGAGRQQPGAAGDHEPADQRGRGDRR
jgi:PAS domain S-box-containing protein